MAKKPLTDYGNQLYSYGLGRNFFDNKPVTRKQMALAAIPENPRTLADNIRRLQMYGGLSGADMPVKNKAFSPYVVPKNVKEATKQVATAGGFEPDLTGAKFDEDGKLIGKTPEDFVPFDTNIFGDYEAMDAANAEILKNLKPGEKPPTKSTMGLMGASDEALAQLGVVEKETSEANRKATEEGKAIFDAKEKIRGAESAAFDKLFEQSMEDYLTNVRGVGPETRTKDLEEYKREFAEATGIDISGKVDKSTALMSLGLALMQNRAGKGFNVGRILSAVGEAGEAALPALEKAKTQARNDMIAAGKYALETRAVDKAADAAAAEKLKQRTDYFIIPKGEGVSGTVANILGNKGRLESLNLSELDALRKNENFSKQFDILPGSMWSSVVTEVMKTPEAKETHDTKTPRKLELFGEGASDLFTIETWRALPGYGKENLLVGTGTDTYKALASAARDLNKSKEKFVEIMPLVEGTNIFRFAVDKVDAAASAFGINLREGATPTQKLKLFLTRLQAQNAKEILGEAGKTISDADRALVASIVSDLNAGSQPEEIQEKLDQLFNDIIIKKEQQIIDALSSLDRYTGRNVASLLGSDGYDEDDEAELAAALKALGVES